MMELETSTACLRTEVKLNMWVYNTRSWSHEKQFIKSIGAELVS